MDTRGDILIRGLWDRHTYNIIDIKLGFEANTCRFEPLAALLYWWEKIKKDKHGKHCHGEQKHFSRFVISVDGMIGRETLVVLMNLSQLLAEKIYQLIFHVQGWINGRIAISIKRS